MYLQAKAMQKRLRKANPKANPSLKSVLRVWKSLTGTVRREYGPMRDDIVESGSNVRSNMDIERPY
jgi:hypothetical protein